jgi:HEAT repeat protein
MSWSDNSMHGTFSLLVLVFLGLPGAEPCPAGETPPKKATGVPGGAEPDGRRSPTGKADCRYDGKPFDHWRTCLQTELKAERRLEALEALKAFAANGYRHEAAEAALDTAKTYAGDLSDKDKEVLSKAVSLFRDVGPGCEPKVVKVLNDGNKTARGFAATVLASHFEAISAEAFPGLVRVVLEGKEDVSGVGRFVPVLVRALEEIREDRPEIAAALGRFGPAAKDAIPVLTGVLQDQDPKVQQAAADALRKIGKGEK